MSVEIRDGKGTTFTAKVTSANQLSVAADSIPRAGKSCFDGKLHGVTTDAIALTTTASFNGVFYLKNDSSDAVYLWHIAAFATENARWQYVKNPTAGTLLTSGTLITATNLNFASTLTFDGEIRKGANAQTVTDGETFLFGGNPAFDSTFHIDDSPIILGQSDALALLCRPEVACDAYVSALMSQEALDL